MAGDKYRCYTPTSSRGLSWSFSDRKSMSLDVTIPTSLLPILPVSVTGIPEKPCRIFASNTSPTVCRGVITTGSVMKPCSNFWRDQTALSQILRHRTFLGQKKLHPTQTFLPWPYALHWPEIQRCSCDELFQSRPSTERRTATSQKPFPYLWNCHCLCGERWWNKTDATMFVFSSCTYCHGDGHRRLCHCIHRRRNEGSLQGYFPR